MQVTISDPQTVEALGRLAAECGKSAEEVVRDLVTERGRDARVQPAPRPDWQDRLEFIRRVGRRAAAKVPEDRRVDNHGDLLYDEHGLPK